MTSEGGAVSILSLDELRAQITTLGEKVKSLKSQATEVDKDALAAAVQELLDAKRLFAERNNGIGVDGKKWEEPMSKAEKKAKAKAEKGGAGPAKETADPNSESSKKKAAKKAEAKAKKAALKAAAKTGGVGAGGADGVPTAKTVPAPAVTAPAAAGTETPKPAPTPRAAVASRPAAAAALASGVIKSKLQPFQLAFNPNSALSDRPVVSLTVAILTNTILDYTLVSDHTRPHDSGLGLPSGGGELVGDMAIARFISRRSLNASTNNGMASKLVSGRNDEKEREETQALVEQWMDYALTISRFEPSRKVRAVTQTLDRVLANKTYVVKNSMTLADIALFASLGFPSQVVDRKAIQAAIGNESSPTLRWIQMMSSLPAIREATQLAVGIANHAEAIFDEDSPPSEPLVPGMNPLQGATPGNVVTRFPPEPSGYLHIGHAKAVLLNDYYAQRYRGRLIVRFDDTNPTKEKEEFQSSILQDLGKLGVKADVVTFTSDYFETIRQYAEYMIQNGLAYMDDTPQEQMQKERLERVESKHRNTQTVDECMEYFRLMSSGEPEGAKWCLRAKIDMTSVNGTMRDPVIYRQNVTPHHRSGTKYKAYPTYDLACPIVDSIEGVTHALRTTEYNDRDEQYQWIQTALNLRRVRIHSFARMNFQYTELSKRKLTWFVENGYVTGWDDARFPTVRGVVRRGINITALRNFICSQGASRRIVNMEWNKFWAENKKEIDKVAKRFMAIDATDHVALRVTNGPEIGDYSYITTDYLPKDPSFGKRVVRIAKKVLLEKVDAEGLVVGEDIVLVRWGVVKITKVDGGLEGTFLPDGDVKAANRKLSWIANVSDNIRCILTEFDNLITKEKLEEDDNFKDYINENTMAATEVIGDAGLKTLQEHEIIQLERRGYYRVDHPYMSEGKPLVLYMIPDGKRKAMSGLTGKLAHH